MSHREEGWFFAQAMAAGVPALVRLAGEQTSASSPLAFQSAAAVEPAALAAHAAVSGTQLESWYKVEQDILCAASSRLQGSGTRDTWRLVVRIAVCAVAESWVVPQAFEAFCRMLLELDNNEVAAAAVEDDGPLLALALLVAVQHAPACILEGSPSALFTACLRAVDQSAPDAVQTAVRTAVAALSSEGHSEPGSDVQPHALARLREACPLASDLLPEQQLED